MGNDLHTVQGDGIADLVSRREVERGLPDPNDPWAHSPWMHLCLAEGLRLLANAACQYRAHRTWIDDAYRLIAHLEEHVPMTGQPGLSIRLTPWHAVGLPRPSWSAPDEEMAAWKREQLRIATRQVTADAHPGQIEKYSGDYAAGVRRQFGDHQLRAETDVELVCELKPKVDEHGKEILVEVEELDDAYYEELAKLREAHTRKVMKPEVEKVCGPILGGGI